jgi:hypothetical protein
MESIGREDILTPEEAARLVKMNYKTFKHYIRVGNFPPEVMWNPIEGREYRFHKQRLLDFMFNGGGSD